MITETVLDNVTGVICNADGDQLYAVRPRALRVAFDALVAAGLDTVPIFGERPVFGIRRVEDGSVVKLYDSESELLLIEYDA